MKESDKTTVIKKSAEKYRVTFQKKEIIKFGRALCLVKEDLLY
jgi:hypothetical protein